MFHAYINIFLLSICKAARLSKSAHVPERAFARRVPVGGSEIKKALRKLISLGYIQMHPTRGEMTYQLTIEGIKLCREIASS